jgi:hypothetical protein
MRCNNMVASEVPQLAGATRRRIAWACTFLMFVVVVASAFLRQHAGEALQAAWASEIAWARQVHRLAATLVLLGAVALVLWARRARDRSALRTASALLGTALLLSGVGLAAGASRAAPVLLVNLLGGFAMLALCARLTLAQSWIPASPLRRSACWLLAVAALQAAAGVWAGAQVQTECVGVSGCEWPALLHRAAGLLLGYAMLLFGILAAWRARPAGAALAVAALLLLLLGMLIAAAGGQARPALLVLHNALAAVAVALLARIA